MTIKKIVFLLFFIFFGISSFGIVNAETQSTIKVATIERPPYVEKDNNEDYSGFSIELIKELARENNYKVEFVHNTVFKDMLKSVETGEVNLAIANISITEQREAVMDFSQPIYNSGLRILARSDKVSKNIFKVIWESGILLFLTGALLVLLLVAHLVWFFERGEKMKHNYFRDDYFGGIWDAFWWAFIIATMGGFENEQPKHYVGRALALFWVLTSLFFVSTLTAQITTSLTLSELSGDIESYKDLNKFKVGAPEGTTISEFLDNEDINYIPFDDFNKALKALENKELEAVVGDAAVVERYVKNRNDDTLKIVGPLFAKDDIGIAFPENSSYFEDINSALIKMKRDGRYEKLVKKYFSTQ